MAISSQSQKEATSRYRKKAYETFNFSVRRDSVINEDVIREHVAKRGESLNAFLNRAVVETIERDNMEVAENAKN